MSSKTKIVVLHLKEVIYTGIFVALGILFIILLLVLLLPGKKTSGAPETPSVSEGEATPTSYIPGIYTTSLALGEQILDVEVIVNQDAISSIRLVNLSESITTMYPLIGPAFDSLVNQIYENGSTAGLTYADENKYTSLLLIDAIENALKKAVIVLDIKDNTP